LPFKKLKIGFLLDDTLDTPDGVQQYVLTVGKWMSNQGHEVHYLVGQTHRRDIDNVHSMAKNIKVSFNQK
jgi:phosphatidylinositol alpha-mannosyltransferase